MFRICQVAGIYNVAPVDSFLYVPFLSLKEYAALFSFKLIQWCFFLIYVVGNHTASQKRWRWESTESRRSESSDRRGVAFIQDTWSVHWRRISSQDKVSLNWATNSLKQRDSRETAERQQRAERAERAERERERERAEKVQLFSDEYIYFIC